ncbi:MAG: hypothetical protein J6S61_01315, partial [Elusimicrobiaceae bacterium]|nr:hypothetical protein [Elusimicrobiaceae bacterium]
AQINALSFGSEESKPKINYEWWASSIFTDNPELRASLIENYQAYDEIRYNQNWRNSPYGNMSPEEIDKEINNYFNSIRKSLKQNPIYSSNRMGQNLGELGIVLTSIAAFEALYMLAQSAVPYAATAESYSTLSGFATMFPKEMFKKELLKEGILASNPIFMARAGKGVKYIGSIIGGSFQVYGSSVITETALDIKAYILGTFDNSNSSLGAQADVQTALRHAITLSNQIKEINADKNLTVPQKRKRINTRYKEAIIRIYALDYVDTYLTYSEKPEKYLWAIFDLTTLLQNRGTVTFEGDYGKTIEIESVPRLIERKPQIQQSLEQIMASIINGFKIKPYGRYLQNKVEKRALKNIEKAEFNFDF